MDFSIRSEYSIIFAIAAVMIAAVAAYYYYKGSTAQGGLRKVLTALRFLSLLFILLLLMSPVLSFIIPSEKKPVDIILVDDSKSVSLTGNEAFSEKVENAKRLNTGNQKRYFLFSDGIDREASDSELPGLINDTIRGSRSNLSKALTELKELIPGENIASVTVITDGILNEGGNPLQSGLSLGAPVSFFLTGDTAGGKDLSLKKVFFNKTAFIESSVPIRAELESRGINGTVRVNLFEDERLADSKEISITDGKMNYDVGFTVSSNEQKTSRYRISADIVEGEITDKNNFADFFISFIDNKFRMLVLAGSPSSDLAFIREQMAKIRNFTAEYRTQKGPGEFYEGALPSLQGFDAVMLIGFPNFASDDRVINEISTAAGKFQLPLIFFASRNIDAGKLSVISEFLPFTMSGSSEGESETKLSVVSGPGNEFFRDNKIAGIIGALPSVFKSDAQFVSKPDATTVVVAERNSSPALIVSGSDDRRSAALLVYGLYKWRLGGNVTAAEEALGYLLANMTSAVSKKEAGKTMNVLTGSQVYSPGDRVDVKSFITGFDKKGNENMKIKINGPGMLKEADMRKISSGEFAFDEEVTAEGVYDYEVSLISEGRNVETVSGKFLVGENNFEYIETNANPILLNELASSTGGRMLNNNMSDEEIESLIETSRKADAESVMTSRSFDLNINPYYLGLVILLLSIEWFLRKRNNLP